MDSAVLCFLCTKDSNDNDEFYDVSNAVVPASQKPLHIVLQHLANRIKFKLIFQNGTFVCSECFKELSDYDNLMLNLLTSQKLLTNRLQNALNDKPEVVSEDGQDYEIQLEVEEDATGEDAFNPELDTKEELIEVDDNVIVEEFRENLKRCKRECLACEEVFKSNYQLQNHINEVHNIAQFICKICGVARKDEEYLELHMNIHQGKTENQCLYCPKVFSRPVNTLRHMRFHWQKKFQCDKCGGFSLDNMLYNHRLRHEAEENPVICNFCNQSFKSRKTYNHHLLIHQTNRPRHHCHLCPKSFTQRYTLKMHLKTHNDSNTPTPVDTKPGDFKETEAAINILVESIDREFQCVICNLKFESKSAHVQHLQEEHDVIP
ncbi:LOW QUALITY PROTEIN: serendipity delta [Glossina fuscipes fuscipes]